MASYLRPPKLEPGTLTRRACATRRRAKTNKDRGLRIGKFLYKGLQVSTIKNRKGVRSSWSRTSSNLRWWWRSVVGIGSGTTTGTLVRPGRLQGTIVSVGTLEPTLLASGYWMWMYFYLILGALEAREKLGRANWTVDCTCSRSEGPGATKFA